MRCVGFVGWSKDGWFGIGESFCWYVDGVFIAFFLKLYDLFFLFPFGLLLLRDFSLLIFMIFRVMVDQTRWIGTLCFVSLRFSQAKEMVFFVTWFGQLVARMFFVCTIIPT